MTLPRSLTSRPAEKIYLLYSNDILALLRKNQTSNLPKNFLPLFVVSLSKRNRYDFLYELLRFKVKKAIELLQKTSSEKYPHGIILGTLFEKTSSHQKFLIRILRSQSLSLIKDLVNFRSSQYPKGYLQSLLFSEKSAKQTLAIKKILHSFSRDAFDLLLQTNISGELAIIQFLLNQTNQKKLLEAIWDVIRSRYTPLLRAIHDYRSAEYQEGFLNLYIQSVADNLDIQKIGELLSIKNGLITKELHEYKSAQYPFGLIYTYAYWHYRSNQMFKAVKRILATRYGAAINLLKTDFSEPGKPNWIIRFATQPGHDSRMRAIRSIIATHGRLLVQELHQYRNHEYPDGLISYYIEHTPSEKRKAVARSLEEFLT